MSIAPSRSIPAYPEPGESLSPVEVTYDEYMAMPESNRHVEVVDGVIFVMAGAAFEHQEVVVNLLIELKPQIKRADLGLLLTAPADVIIRKRPKLRVRQPDLMFFSNARAGFPAGSDPARVQAEGIAPDLAVKVLSPGQDETTLADKLADYASILVDEVWFADQATKTVRVLSLDEGVYRHSGEFGMGDRVASAVLPGIDLDVSAIFA